MNNGVHKMNKYDRRSKMVFLAKKEERLAEMPSTSRFGLGEKT
jgi:hypothetical protein